MNNLMFFSRYYLLLRLLTFCSNIPMTSCLMHTLQCYSKCAIHPKCAIHHFYFEIPRTCQNILNFTPSKNTKYGSVYVFDDYYEDDSVLFNRYQRQRMAPSFTLKKLMIQIRNFVVNFHYL